MKRFSPRAGLTLATVSVLCCAAYGQGTRAPEPASSAASSQDSAPAPKPRFVCDRLPEYPAAAVRSNAAGVTRMEVLVAANGKILESRILAPSGSSPEHKLLDDAALSAVAQCRMDMPPGTPADAQPTRQKIQFAWKPDIPAGTAKAEPGQIKCDQLPEYPAAARRALVTGTTRVELTWMPDGTVLDVRLLKSSGSKPENQLLDRLTVESMMHCRMNVSPSAVVGDEPRTSPIEYVWRIDNVPHVLPPAMEDVTKGAEAGDVDAQVELAARLSARRPHTDANEEMATQWYKRAADQGSAKALMKLGERARLGVGMPPSFEQGLTYYRRAAELGERDANYWVADAYAKGRGVAADPKQALAWHLRAAAAGYMPSALLAGDLCRDASPADPKRALMYYLIGDRVLRETLAARKGGEARAVPAQWQRDADIARLKSQLGDTVTASIAATAAAWTRGQPLPE